MWHVGMVIQPPKHDGRMGSQGLPPSPDPPREKGNAYLTPKVLRPRLLSPASSAQVFGAVRGSSYRPFKARGKSTCKTCRFSIG